jgi:hypothetical protein
MSYQQIQVCLELLTSLLQSVEQILDLLAQNQILSDPIPTSQGWGALIQRQKALYRIMRNLDLIGSHVDLNLHNVNVARYQLLETSNQVQQPQLAIPSSTTAVTATEPKRTPGAKRPAYEETEIMVPKKSTGGTSEVVEDKSPATPKPSQPAASSDSGPVAATVKVDIPQNQYQAQLEVSG